ncbi:hypothetical protein J2T17_007474 [Paenibacillus mucilaginosus]|uniref:hypothetical protein n=1 Tax=Paenibacillus mucilaginosus TaxID=61624 RepID=UPI003D2035E7
MKKKVFYLNHNDEEISHYETAREDLEEYGTGECCQGCGLPMAPISEVTIGWGRNVCLNGFCSENKV